MPIEVEYHYAQLLTATGEEQEFYINVVINLIPGRDFSNNVTVP